MGEDREIEITFSDEQMQRCCNDEREGQKAWDTSWPSLKRRLAVLAAARVLSDIESTPGRCQPLGHDRGRQFAVKVSGRFRLTFEVATNPLPVTPEGVLDRARVTEIRILEMEEYQGD